MNTGQIIDFPPYAGVQCLMMPYIQGETGSVPDAFASYRDIIKNVFVQRGDIGYLTIDESEVFAGKAQRGYRAKHGRALHTEAVSYTHLTLPTIYSV